MNSYTIIGLAFIGLAVLGMIINLTTGSSAVWWAIFPVAVTFYILLVSGALEHNHDQN